MPGRHNTFQNNNIYHIFNKTIDNRVLFNNSKLATRFLDTIRYYRSFYSSISYSQYLLSVSEIRQIIDKKLNFQKYFRVDILAFCLMPTHYHLLIRQIRKNGIVSFISNSANSFTRYYNFLHQRNGPLFIPRFKSREVITDEQLLHTFRYIHLNPYSSGVVNRINKLKNYPWSSYKMCISSTAKDELRLTNPKVILESFNSEPTRYQSFVEKQTDYQKELEELKYLRKW